MPIQLKRVFDEAEASDGARVLVDRLWPRGVSKERASLTAWLKDLAPSDELRRWYHARPSQWEAFRKKYLAELRAPAAEKSLQELYGLMEQNSHLTLLFASRNLDRNNATVIKELMDGSRKPPSTSGAIRAAAEKRARARAPRSRT